MSNFTINHLNNELADTMRMLKNKEIDIETAKAVSQIAQTIINGVKVEVDFVRVTGGFGTGFFPQEVDPFEKEIPQYAIEGMRDCSFCLVESVVRPDAPTVNTLTACDSCLKMPSTIHFRRQLELQKNAKQIPAKGARLTDNHKEILDYLKENGGEATIGAMFGDTKTQVVTRLLRLEELHYIECVKRPVSRADFPPNRRNQVTDEELHCGVWKITNVGMKAA